MKLSIVILNYNTKEHLSDVLDSLEKNVLPVLKEKVEVVVVDNGSTDGSVGMVKKRRGVTLIALKKNVGYAAGNNKGIGVARGEYVMLLNSDAKVTETGSIADLLTYLDNHRDIAVLSPKVVLAGGQLDWASHRGFPTPWSAFTYFLGLRKLIPKSKLFGGYHMTWQDLSAVHEIDACSGAAMIVRKEAMKNVGLLDERFFMYAEDIDWCYRFKEAGWKVMYHPGLTIFHHKYQSGRKHGKHTDVGRQSTAMFYDTMMQFYEKHYAEKYPRIVTIAVKLGLGIIKVLKGV